MSATPAAARANLRDIRSKAKVNLVFLTSAAGSPFNDPKTYAQYLTPAGLKELSRFVAEVYDE